MHIIVNKVTADKLKGRIDKYNSCLPIKMTNGDYAIPESVLIQFPEYFKRVKVKLTNHIKRKVMKEDFPIVKDILSSK